MGSIGDYLTRHHKECDEVFVRSEESASSGDWVAVERDCSRYLKEMKRHLAMEEDLLFPAFQEKSGIMGGPTEIMRMEHDQMRAIFEELGVAVRAKDAEQYLGLSETLLVLMQQHNMKEEGILYPMLDQFLGAEAEGLLAQMESTAT